MTRRQSQHKRMGKLGCNRHTPALIEGLLVAETNRCLGAVPSPLEDPAVFLGEGEGAVRAGIKYQRRGRGDRHWAAYGSSELLTVLPP